MGDFFFFFFKKEIESKLYKEITECSKLTIETTYFEIVDAQFPTDDVAR
jgi:hypothetical protein